MYPNDRIRVLIGSCERFLSRTPYSIELSHELLMVVACLYWIGDNDDKPLALFTWSNSPWMDPNDQVSILEGWNWESFCCSSHLIENSHEHLSILECLYCIDDTEESSSTVAFASNSIMNDSFGQSASIERMKLEFPHYFFSSYRTQKLIYFLESVPILNR